MCSSWDTITTTTTTSHTKSVTILKELSVSPSDIETEDVIFYAKLIGIDPISEPELLWIAQAGLISPLPAGWIGVEDSKGRLFYYDRQRKTSSWEHPNDSFYRSLVKRYRATSWWSTGTMSGPDGGDFNTSSIANLHFFDDEDHNEENDHRFTGGGGGDELEMEKQKPEDEKTVHNDWATTENLLPQSNENQQLEANTKEEKDQEESIDSVAAVVVEFYEIENQDEENDRIEQVSDDQSIEEIIENDDDDDDDGESIDSLKELEMEEVEKSVVKKTETTGKHDDEDGKDLREGMKDSNMTDESDALIHSAMMDSLIEQDLFDDDDEIFSDTDDRQFGIRRSHRPQSASVAKQKQHQIVKQEQSNNHAVGGDKAKQQNGTGTTLSVVQEEDSIGDDGESGHETMQNSTVVKGESQGDRMSQMGLIRANPAGVWLQQTAAEQINEQHQSLNGIGDISKIGPLSKMEPMDHQEEGNDGEDDVDYELEEFDSESNSKASRDRVTIDGPNNPTALTRKMFQDISQRLENEIANLRQELRLEFKDSDDLLQQRIDSQWNGLNDRIETLEREQERNGERLSRKIDELNLSFEKRLESLQSAQSSQLPDSDAIDTLIKENVNHVMHELQQNLEQRLKTISINLEKTITNEMEKLSRETEMKFDSNGWKQMIRQELSVTVAGWSESINQNQSETSRLVERLRAEFHSTVLDVQALCTKSMESVETLRKTIQTEKNFWEVNWRRLETNIAQLEEKFSENNRDKSSEKTLPPEHIQNMIDQEKESMNRRLDEFQEKLDSLMQQIDLKLKSLQEQSEVPVVKQSDTIGGHSGNEITRPPEHSHFNYNEKRQSNHDKDGQANCHNDQESKETKVEKNDSNKPGIEDDNDGGDQTPINCHQNQRLKLLRQCNELKNLLEQYQDSAGETVVANHSKRSTNTAESKRTERKKSKNTIRSPSLPKSSSSSGGGSIHSQNKLFHNYRSKLDDQSSQYHRSGLSHPVRINDDGGSSSSSAAAAMNWWQSTPNLNDQTRSASCCGCCHRDRNHHPIYSNELPKMKRLHRSYGNLSQNNDQVRLKDTSSSLIAMIKQTTNQLKQELSNLEMMNKQRYDDEGCPAADDDNNGDDHGDRLLKDNDWPNLPNPIDSRHKNANTDNRLSSSLAVNDDHSTLPSHQDQVLMFRLWSIRNSVNDRLMKISSAIEQQKITQI